MEEYVRLLVLAYFREYGDDYSLYELKSFLGITIKKVEVIIEKLISEGLLEYDEYVLALSVTGRIVLSESKMENYSFKGENYCKYSKIDRWALDQPYPIHGFSNDKWRGSEQ